MTRQPNENAFSADDTLPIEGAVVEIPVLLESWQLTALATAASAHGLTAGALVRSLLRDFLTCCENDCPASSPSRNASKQEQTPVFVPFSSTGRGG